MSAPYRPHFTAIALGTLVTIGLQVSARGVILPRLLSDLSISPTTGATIMAASSIGTFVASSSFGAIAQRFGLKRVSATGCLLALISLSLFLTLRNPLFLWTAMVGVGAGMSMLELSASLPVSLLYANKQGGILNLLHGFFGIGALLGPVWMMLWLGSQAGWRTPFGLIFLLMALLVAYYQFLPSIHLPAKKGNHGDWGPILRDSLVWTAALGLMTGAAAEYGVSLWLPSYLQQVKGLSETTSAFYATAYFSGFTATRLTAAWLVDRLGYIRSVIGLALIGIVGLLALLLLPGVSVIIPVIIGMGTAAVFPTCLALVAIRHPSRVNQAYSVMYASGALAGMTVTPLMGWVSQTAGMSTVMIIPLVAIVVVIGCLAVYGRGSKPVPV